DLAAVSQNIRNLKSALAEGTRLMAVVKADAYGHGAVPVAKEVLAAGADCLAVARIGEAVELRHAGIKCPILIFGRTEPSLTSRLMAHDLTQTVFSLNEASAMSERARAAGGKLRIHVKVDTGMGRLGVLAGGGRRFEDSVGEIDAISRLQGLDAEGIYTHFATADESDKTNAGRQFDLFRKIVAHLCDRGVGFALRHAANSAALLDMPETHLDMVRPGISIYGHYPSGKTTKLGVELTPAMSVRARIIHLKEVGPGFKVSYGWTAETTEKTVIATVAAGYADGFFRLLSSRGAMLVRGRRAPVIGRVCMDNTMIDVGHVPEAAIGDTVLIFGREGCKEIPAEELAGYVGTINYEVLSRISPRVPRIYPREK
ncbi:MAG: alanine racemase, partial [Thermodesulfobacteriota bacterium]